MAVSIADMDEDGKLEITFESSTPHNGCSGSGVNGNGTRTTDGDFYTIVIDEDGNEEFTLSYTADGESDGNFNNLFVDMDRDGVWEILALEGHHTAYYHGTSQIHLIDVSTHSITRTFNGARDAQWGIWPPYYPTIVDINGDGKDEVIVTQTQYNGGEKKWISLGTYVLSPELSNIDSTDTGGFVCVANDLNGDGQIEIIMRDGESIRVVDNELNELWSFTAGGEIGDNVIVSDTNLDGRNEIIFLADKLYVLEGGSTEASPIEGLVGYWGFNEGSGDTAHDSSGNGNDGIISDATWVDSGNCGKALSFDGVDDYVDCGHTDSLTLTTFSVSAWIRIEDGDGFNIPVVNKGGYGYDSPGKNANYGLSVDDNKFSGGFEEHDGKDHFVESSDAYNDGNWHFVVVTYDKKYLILYVDGDEVDREETSANPELDNTRPLTIGKNALLDDRYFNGQVDEVRIYNRALTQSEIQEDMKKCSPTEVAPVDSNWRLTYSTDFSVDPEWTTNIPANYYWDSTEGVYHIKNVKDGTYGYCYKAITWQGGSFKLEWDERISNTLIVAEQLIGMAKTNKVTESPAEYISTNFAQVSLSLCESLSC